MEKTKPDIVIDESAVTRLEDPDEVASRMKVYEGNH